MNALDNSRIDAIVSALETHASASKTANKSIVYFDRNRKRMQYSRFLTEELCVSFGVVEELAGFIDPDMETFKAGIIKENKALTL